ncbi:MAG: hypothetical protein BRD55_09410 [Bacteroidetes bacterium SW_9_63_38]|nr:MAG: hypothetical protein BRD55_09410 [Bacteroidetes bacterium SW_9_63_38]
MLYLLVLLMSLHASFADRVQDAYAREDADALRTLLQDADTRTDSLLVRYRLYPLTENADLVNDLPETLDDGTAREWALLSGLWSYRAGEASLFNAVTYGRRSANLLETAQSIDPDDPYVLLIGGQSLLFRPAVAGKDSDAAAQQFDQLAELAEQNKTDGIPPVEAYLWKWLALKEADRPDDAQALHKQLGSRTLAPLYQQFIDDPPDV